MSPRRRAIRNVLAIAKTCDAKGGAYVPIEDHTRGGYIVGSTSVDRMVYAYTLENAKAVQAILARFAGYPVDKLHSDKGLDKRGRRMVCRCRSCVAIRHSIGDYCSIETAEAELVQALHDPKTYARDRSAGRMKRLREKRKAAGLCHCGDQPREDRATCSVCNARSAEVVARTRIAVKEYNDRLRLERSA